MLNYDDYLELYDSNDEWYYNFVDKELKRLKRRSDKNEREKTIQRNK